MVNVHKIPVRVRKHLWTNNQSEGSNNEEIYIREKDRDDPGF